MSCQTSVADAVVDYFTHSNADFAFVYFGSIDIAGHQHGWMSDAYLSQIETVDEALPALGERPSRREKVVDAALDMADKLTTTQYEFLRTVVRSADRSLGTSDSDTT